MASGFMFSCHRYTCVVKVELGMSHPLDLLGHVNKVAAPYKV